MDASTVERPVQEVIAEKLKLVGEGLDRADELVQRTKRIIDRMATEQVPPCEGICPTCGKAWDQHG